jgi:hypothetical protein
MTYNTPIGTLHVSSRNLKQQEGGGGVGDAGEELEDTEGGVGNVKGGVGNAVGL